ncbi:HAMP domain-containing protein, partial [Bosea sp. BH3]|uniref:HAMP domain-containing protein n=1 Tax=Bosea sp. BH3 TaxID=2871701 RepID=UPI0021CB2250
MKSIRLKILAMLAIVAGGAILTAIISFYGLQKADDLNTRSQLQGNVALVTQQINGLVTAVVMESRGVYMAKTPQEQQTYAKGIEDRFSPLRKFTAELQRIAPEEERASVGQIAKAVEEFIAFRAETARLGRDVSPAAANEQGNTEANRANRKALNDLLIGFSQRIEKASITVGDEATAFTRQIQWLMPLVLLTTLLASVGVALVFAQRSITRPILDLSHVMEKLTKGDTAVEVPHAKRGDEIGAMARSVAVLRSAIEQVAELQEQERAAAATRLARAQSIEAVVSDVGEVVAAAAAGDFSARLEIKDADEQMQRLVAGINEINAVV